MARGAGWAGSTCCCEVTSSDFLNVPVCFTCSNVSLYPRGYYSHNTDPSESESWICRFCERKCNSYDVVTILLNMLKFCHINFSLRMPGVATFSFCYPEIISFSGDNGLFSRDDGPVYQVSFAQVMESECVFVRSQPAASLECGRLKGLSRARLLLSDSCVCSHSVCLCEAWSSVWWSARSPSWDFFSELPHRWQERLHAGLLALQIYPVITGKPALIPSWQNDFYLLI